MPEGNGLGAHHNRRQRFRDTLDSITGIVLSASSLKPNQGVLARAYKAVKSHIGLTRGDIASLVMMTPPEGVPLVMLGIRIITACTVRFSRHPLSQFVTDVSSDVAIGTVRGATSETISNNAMSEWPTLRRWASEKDKFIMRLYAFLLLSMERDGYTMETEIYSTIDTDQACRYFMRNVRSDVQKALRVFAKEEAIQPQKLLRKCRCAALLAALLVKVSQASDNSSKARMTFSVGGRDHAWQEIKRNEDGIHTMKENARQHDPHDSAISGGEREGTSLDEDDFEREQGSDFIDSELGSTGNESEREQRQYQRRKRRLEREAKRDRPASRQDLDELWAEVERLRALVRNKKAPVQLRKLLASPTATPYDAVRQLGTEVLT